MSRVIKFRGLCQDGKWYYGNLITIIKQGGWWTAIQHGNDEDEEDLTLYSKPIYDSSTIGQYTGLKDKNDKEIYEGDIVESNNNKYKVVFDEGSFKIEYVYFPHWEMEYLGDICFLCEVVGNIYENPELLKE